MVLEQPEVLGHDFFGRRALEAQVAKLKEQTLLQVARGDARGIEALEQPQRAVDVGHRPRPHRRQLLERGDQIPVVVEIPVTNTGARAGAEVVQLYVEPVAPPVFRPAKELKAFQKVSLEPGATTTVTLQLDDRAFAYWQPDGRDYAAIRARTAATALDFTLGQTDAPATPSAGWRVHPGAYRLHVGRSVQDIAHVVDINRGRDEATHAQDP
jgi:hypothetical protein